MHTSASSFASNAGRFLTCWRCIGERNRIDETLAVENHERAAFLVASIATLATAASRVELFVRSDEMLVRNGAKSVRFGAVHIASGYAHRRTIVPRERMASKTIANVAAWFATLGQCSRTLAPWFASVGKRVRVIPPHS